MTFIAAAIGAGLGYGVAGSLAGAAIGAGVGGMIGGSVNQANAAESAASAQQAAATNATQLQQNIFDTINKQQTPYRGAGVGALNTLQSLMPGQYTKYDAAGNPIGTATGTGDLTRTFSNADLNSQLAPNYQFMLGQGMNAARQTANVGGGGSNILKSGIKFAEDYAGNAYQNAFNNFQLQQGNIYNRLAGIAGIGQTGQSQTNQAATNYGNAASQLGIGSATAYGAGQVGAANAYSNIGNNFLQAAMASKFLG